MAKLVNKPEIYTGHYLYFAARWLEAEKVHEQTKG